MNNTKTMPSVMLFPYGVFVLDDPQMLFNEAYYRQTLAAEIYVFSSLDEAFCFAHQRYGFRFFNDYDHREGGMIPLSDDAPYAIVDDPKCAPLSVPSPTEGAQAGIIAPWQAPMLSVPIQEAGFWSVSSINGCAAASSLNALFSILLEGTLSFPHAQAWWNGEIALYKAWEEYVRRFFIRYDGHTQNPIWPTKPLQLNEIFIDPLFEQREQDSPTNGYLRAWQRLGLM